MLSFVALRYVRTYFLIQWPLANILIAAFDVCFQGVKPTFAL